MMKGFAANALRLGAGTAVLLLTVAWLSGGCEEKVMPGRAERDGRLAEGALTATVARSVEPASERASGSIASSRQTTIAARILARIDAVTVAAGDFVQRGELLVRLDARDLEARLAAAREALRAARARFELARREQQRVERLFERNVASVEDLDKARAAANVAEAALKGAEQRVADARVALSDAEIHSPVTGRVVDRLAEAGDMAAPGTPLLRVYDPSVLRLEAPVRESLAVTLRVGQALRAQIDAIGETLDGRIGEIVPFAEPGARTLLVKVQLPEDPRLFAGMFGRLEIPAGETVRLLVPATAVTQIGQLRFATAVDTEGRLERRWVTTGPPRDDDRVEILSGLAAGERVRLPHAPSPATLPTQTPTSS